MATKIEDIIYGKILAAIQTINIDPGKAGMMALATSIARDHAEEAGPAERENCLRMTEDIKAGRMTQADGKAEATARMDTIVSNAMTAITSAINQ